MLRVVQVVRQQRCSGHCLSDSVQAQQLKQQLHSAQVSGQWRGDTAITLPLFWRRSTVSPVFFGRFPRSSLHLSLITHLTLPAQHTTFNTLDNWAIKPLPNQKGKGPERKGYRVMARNMYTIHSVTHIYIYIYICVFRILVDTLGGEDSSVVRAPDS